MITEKKTFLVLVNLNLRLFSNFIKAFSNQLLLIFEIFFNAIILDVGHWPNDSISASCWARHSWSIHHEASAWRTRWEFTEHSVYDRANLRWRRHEISSYVADHSVQALFVIIKYLVFVRFFAALFNLPGLFDDFSDNLNSVLPIALNYDHHDSLVQEYITTKINEFYFANNLSKEKEKNVTNVSWFWNFVTIH